MIKQTKVEEIGQYSTDAGNIFAGMADELNVLLEQSATFTYNGKNAMNFKENTVLNAKAFVAAVKTTNESMAAAISARTGYITSNLGGTPVTVKAPELEIVETAIDCDPNIETAVAEDFNSLKATIESVFQQVRDAYTAHDTRFNDMGAGAWLGPEFEQTSGEVAEMTGDAHRVVTENETLMIGAIDAQMQALGMS